MSCPKSGAPVIFSPLSVTPSATIETNPLTIASAPRSAVAGDADVRAFDGDVLIDRHILVIGAGEAGRDPVAVGGSVDRRLDGAERADEVAAAVEQLDRLTEIESDVR
jgi:hypothetical protein